MLRCLASPCSLDCVRPSASPFPPQSPFLPHDWHHGLFLSPFLLSMSVFVFITFSVFFCFRRGISRLWPDDDEGGTASDFPNWTLSSRKRVYSDWQHDIWRGHLAVTRWSFCNFATMQFQQILTFYNWFLLSLFICIFLYCFACQYQSNDWLRRPPPKWPPILCRVGR